jgi:AraC-like DNA-binding protein
VKRTGPSFSFYHSKTGEPDELVSRETVVLASSRPLGWDGAVAESGTSSVWEPTDLALAGHYLAINLDSKPLPTETRTGRDFRRVTFPPGSFQISPAGQPFTMRILKPSRFGAVELSLPKVRRLLGHDIELRPGLAVVDEPLNEVVRALLAEVARGGSSGPLYAEGLLSAIVSRLACAFSCSAKASARGAPLSGERLTRVKEAIEDRIDRRLTVEELATIAGLSTAHFAREFKRATQETPHAFVLRVRLERARQLLLHGSSIADAAHRCGFSDQAHLSRAFRERFGVTPGVFARTSRR